MAEDTTPPEATATESTEKATTHDGKPVMNVKVYAPFKIYFEGQAYSVSAVNGTGPFDILPHHHKFLCMLVPCNLTIKPVTGDEKTIKIHRSQVMRKMRANSLAHLLRMTQKLGTCTH